MINTISKYKIKSLILEFIRENFGESEMNNPCYNVDLLADYVVKNYDNNIEPYVRTCNECGKEMWEGYCIENGMEYYCCADCLDKNYTDDEWADLYANGDGDSYYTDWYEEQKEYNKLKESEE